MNVKLFVIVNFILFTCFLNAQSSVNCNGIDVTSSNGSMSYTVGQTDFTFFESGTGKASLGVQQAAEIFSSKDLISLSCIIFPNPASSELFLSSADPDYKLFSYQIFDVQGKVVLNGTNVAIDQSIHIEELSTGIYLVSISNAKKEELTCKLIKITP